MLSGNKFVKSASRQPLAICAAIAMLAFTGVNTKAVAQTAETQISDFSGVWRIVDFSEVVRPEDANPQYTEEALRRIENFTSNYDEAVDTPAKFCYHIGMPWSMVSRARDYPTEIYQTPDRVVLFHEGMDMYRHIRLDTEVFPENYVPSGQGYSIAHWDNGDLIIETRGLTATNEVSVHHRSEQARVIERWHLIRQAGQGDRWEITFTLEDPAIFRLPTRGRQLLERAEPGTVVGGYNCPQSLWDDYVETIREEREGIPVAEGEGGSDR